MSKLKIFRSSAGSGKTYQLASEYIKLALQDPDFKYSHILAVTFTNKATAEMKARIILFLQKIANGKDEVLIKTLSTELNLDKETLQHRASIALTKILHHYSLFSVSTIDSFYQRILRSFARETGLIGNFNIELDAQKVLDEVLDLLMDDLGDNKLLTNWLLQYSFERLEQSKNWDIRNELGKFAREIFSTAFKEHEDEFLSIENISEKFDSVIKELNKIIYGFEKHMAGIGKEAEQYILTKGIDIGDFSGGAKRSTFNIFIKIQNNEFNFTTTNLKCLEDKEKWYAQKSPKKELIREAVDEKLDELLHQAYNYYQKNYPEYLSAKVVLENIYTLGIYHEIFEKLAHYKAENDLFLLADTGNFLKDIIADNEAPFIYEKIGAWYDHFLIDEFQDTSYLQWNNFLPLIKNSLAAQQQCLLVGDAKQSIYRWRGGDWSLILDQVQRDIFEEQLNYQFLTTNWRSAPPIVNYNNAVFEMLPQLLSRYFEEQVTDRLDADFKDKYCNNILELYKNVTQQTATHNEEKAGYVEFQFIENQKTSSEWKEEALEWLKQKIEALLENGFQLSDMVILVRSSREGREIVTYLQQLNARYLKTPNSKYNYKAISDESLLIKDHPAIRFIISSLKTILQPSDTIAVEELKTSLLEIRSNMALSIDPAAEHLNFEKVLASFSSLSNYEISEITEHLIRQFDLHKITGATAYLLTFKEALMEFLQKQTSDLATLLNWWEENKDKLAVKMPESVNAIRVMTIHKSKGLEFPVVLIPFCNWEIDHRASQNNYIWCTSEHKPYDALGVLPVKYSSKLEDTYFSNDYFKEKHLAYIDNLNLTYVAFTRAEEALMMCGAVKKSNKNFRLSKISDTLFMAMNNADFELQTYFSQDTGKFIYGDLPPREPEDQSSEEANTLSEYYSSPWQEKVKIKYEASEVLEEIEDRQNINYGLLVHDVLSKVKYHDDFGQVIDQYKWSGLLNDEDYSNVKDQLDRALSNPEINKLFSKGKLIKTEVPIFTSEGKEIRPDRVIIGESETTVVDFKTGKPEPKHKSQVLQYKKVLEQMGYQNVKAKVVYVLQNQVIEF